MECQETASSWQIVERMTREAATLIAGASNRYRATG